MTGLETMITKVSNATAQALMGQRVKLDVESWSLEELRRAALEDEERRFDQVRRTRRRMLRQSCE